ncbi:unnamed protein product [Owenia fusiformis]|uniref:Uncharacterized protein n=1 Tax=Owenia fusiformis TaxID=6347 RepID=A0A8J1UHT9_OWEFU|nr:unnamed protein product [Owenia fusiformis]
MANGTTNATHKCMVDITEQEVIFIIVVTLIMDLTALAILHKMPGKKQSVNHFLVKTLAWNDFVSTLMLFSMWLVSSIQCGPVGGYYGCMLMGWMSTTSTIWSAWIVTIMTFCRYISVKYPITYQQKFTISKVAGILGFTWALTLAQLSLPLFGAAAPYRYYDENKICSYEFAPGRFTDVHAVTVAMIGSVGLLTVVFVIYCNTVLIIKMQQRKKIHARNVKDGITHANANKEPNNTFARVTIVLAAGYTVCYGPFSVRLLIDTANKAKTVNSLWHTISLSLVLLNPLLNPIIYVIFNKNYRKYCRRCLVKPCRKSNTVISAKENVSSR